MKLPITFNSLPHSPQYLSSLQNNVQLARHKNKISFTMFAYKKVLCSKKTHHTNKSGIFFNFIPPSLILSMIYS